MRKKGRKIVDQQDMRDVNGDSHSYENYTDANKAEHVLANPDCLADQPARPSSPQLVMGEAVAHLQGRQKEAYLLVMREDRSFSEAAEILNVSKSTVQTHLDRAIAFITAYCKQAMEGGRI